MNENLDALAKVLSELSERPHDIALHARHIQLAKSLEVEPTEVQSALEMSTQFLAAGEDVWLALIEAKEASVDMGTVEGVEELLALYSRAEADYLCASATASSFQNHDIDVLIILAIRILQKHIQFIIDRYAHCVDEEVEPSALGELFSSSWTRAAIADVVNRGIGHITQVQYVRDKDRIYLIPVRATCYGMPSVIGS
jgi:squamous cell carcinoma antigen recognized by T-cells 3